MDELPATVSDKSAIVYYYEVDAEQTKNLKATVDYVLGEARYSIRIIKDPDCNLVFAGTTGASTLKYSKWRERVIQAGN